MEVRHGKVVRKSKKPRTVHAHRLVWETAQAMAHELYDQIMKNNELYEMWKQACPDLTKEWLEKEFVRLLAPKMLNRARTTLAATLGTNMPERLKEETYEAILRDSALSRGRAN